MVLEMGLARSSNVLVQNGWSALMHVLNREKNWTGKRYGDLTTKKNTTFATSN